MQLRGAFVGLRAFEANLVAGQRKLRGAFVGLRAFEANLVAGQHKLRGHARAGN